MTLSARLGLVCFAWVALIQPPGKPDEATQFARLLLPPLAVLQALHAFPVAGSQVLWSALLLIPVGALCIANGLRWIAFSRGDRSARRTPAAIGTIAATVAMVVLVSSLKQLLDQVRAAYDGSVPLGLPGAETSASALKQAANYRAIVAAIDENCESFVMLPGMNSFYIWTRQDPPAGYEAPELPALVDDARQQQVDRSHPLDRRPLPARKRPAGPVVGRLAQKSRPARWIATCTMASCRSQSSATTSSSSAKGPAADHEHLAAQSPGADDPSIDDERQIVSERKACGR